MSTTGERENAIALRARWLAKTSEARAEIVEAFRKSDGNAVHAARLLGIGHRTLLRYMKDGGIAASVAEIRHKVDKAFGRTP